MSVADKLATIAENEQKVYEKGHADGITANEADGIKAILKKPKSYIDHWDYIQNANGHTAYNYVFANPCWTKETFTPKYDIIDTTGMYTFYGNKMAIDLAEHMNSIGKTLTFKYATYPSNTFAYSHFTRLGEMDFGNALQMSNVFYDMPNLTCIDKVILPYKMSVGKTFANTFRALKKLTSITIGNLIKFDISFRESYILPKDVIAHIVGQLDDETTGRCATFSLRAVNNTFTDEEWLILIATKPTWTFILD